MPTKIIFGQNAVKMNAENLCGYGQKALIVTGKHSSKLNGSLQDCCDALKKQHIEWVLFDRVEENPSLETIEMAAQIGKTEQVDFIIGIGGGSPLDAAKAIGIFINNPDVTRHNVFDAQPLQSLSIIAIPTTSGTGSEVTPYAIVTDHQAKTKRNLGHFVFPEVAFIDPRYTYDLSLQVTVNTAIDAFTHLAEGYLNTRATQFSDLNAEKGFALFGSCLPALKSGHVGPNEREKLMMASTLAGIVIAQTGTSLPHGMGYALTYFKGVPHGLANGVLFSAYLNSFKNREKIDRMVQHLGLKQLESLILDLKELTAVQLEITDEELKEYAQSMASNEGKLKNHPERVNADDLYAIYKASLTK